MKIDWVEQLGVEVVSLVEAASRIKNSDQYYVYLIWKMYTPLPVPFYVGKGHWQRILKHEMESEFVVNVFKANIIKKHKRLGVECGYSIVGFFDDEESAFRAEVDLIDLIGRFDTKSGPLANRTDGGDGSRGHLALKRGESHSARPVIAGGERYACLKDAAESLKVHSAAVYARIKNGWDGYFYEDEGQREQTKKVLGRYKKEVVVGGRRFPSASEASRQLSIDVRMISKRIAFGWEGYYYVEKGQLPRRTVWSSRRDKISVTIRNKDYATIADAVLGTGESLAMISKRCLSSNYPDYRRGDGKIVEKSSLPKSMVGVLVGGVYFKSLREAAQKFGITSGAVDYRCRSEGYPEWSFEDRYKKDARSFSPEFSSRPISVLIKGVSYESQSSAARVHGVDINTLKKRCKSASFPDWSCEGVIKQAPKDNRPGLIGVRIEGKSYRSISEAGRDLGLERSVIRARIASPDWADYEEKA